MRMNLITNIVAVGALSTGLGVSAQVIPLVNADFSADAWFAGPNE